MGAFGGAQKYVSTLSPLGSVFNSIPAPKKTDWDSTSKENKVIIFEFFRSNKLHKYANYQYCK